MALIKKALHFTFGVHATTKMSPKHGRPIIERILTRNAYLICHGNENR